MGWNMLARWPDPQFHRLNQTQVTLCFINSSSAVVPVLLPEAMVLRTKVYHFHSIFLAATTALWFDSICFGFIHSLHIFCSLDHTWYVWARHFLIISYLHSFFVLRSPTYILLHHKRFIASTWHVERREGTGMAISESAFLSQVQVQYDAAAWDVKCRKASWLQEQLHPISKWSETMTFVESYIMYIAWHEIWK